MNLAVLIILQSEGRRGSNERRKCNRGRKGKREKIKKMKRERERDDHHPREGEMKRKLAGRGRIGCF